MKQVCVFSATYPDKFEAALRKLMTAPILLRYSAKQEALVAVKEYAVYCKGVSKGDALAVLLRKVVYTQCVVFCDTEQL